ncbi:MAG: GNAT family N-acetyltransferase, partial [Colwellia sp.]|nr:GNAT family N-acetyltransferase [Colwellia sp.]
MEVSLRPVTKENYEKVCELDITKEQEGYVACNMWSIVESKYNEGYEIRAIYMKEEPVGFFMWVQESKVKISIWRFMVDKEHQ